MSERTRAHNAEQEEYEVHFRTMSGWKVTLPSDVINVPIDQLEKSMKDKEMLFERITNMLVTGHHLHLQDYCELLERLVIDLTEKKEAALQELDKHKQLQQLKQDEIGF